MAIEHPPELIIYIYAYIYIYILYLFISIYIYTYIYPIETSIHKGFQLPCSIFLGISATEILRRQIFRDLGLVFTRPPHTDRPAHARGKSRFARRDIEMNLALHPPNPPSKGVFGLEKHGAAPVPDQTIHLQNSYHVLMLNGPVSLQYPYRL